MESAYGLSLSFRARGGVRALATQALQVFSASPHLHTLQTHYSRSVKPAIPGSVASGCGEHRSRASHHADRRRAQSPGVVRSRRNREYRGQRDAGGATAGCTLCCFPLTKCATLFTPCPIPSPYLRAAFSKALPVAYSLFDFQIAKRYIKPLLLSYPL